MTHECSLQVVTWNCQGAKSNLFGINELLEGADVIFLQETWLEEWEGIILVDLATKNNFGIKFLSGMEPSREKNVGRPFGGLAIMWKKSKVDFVGKVNYGENRRIINLELGFNGQKFNWINVYAPSETKSSEDAFVIMEFWGQLSAEIKSCNNEFIIVGGDFNTDYNRRGSYLEIMLDEVKENELIFGDQKGSNKITYVSKINGSTSWIDHFLVSKNMEGLLGNCFVLDHIMGSDHFPLQVALIMKGAPPPRIRMVNEKRGNKVKFDWKKNNRIHKRQYAWEVTDILNDTLEPKVFECNKKDCSNEWHRRDLQGVCSFLNEVMKYCERKAIPLMKNWDRKGGKQPVAGWNEIVKEKYKDYKEINLKWIKEGRNKQGETFESRKEKLKQYKGAVRFCKKHQKELKVKNIVKANRNIDAAGFWNEINKLRKGGKEDIDRIDGKSDGKEICKMWRDKFLDIGKAEMNDKIFEDVCGEVQTRQDFENGRNNTESQEDLISEVDIVEEWEVRDCLKKLKGGKSRGPDGIVGEQLKWGGGTKLWKWICKLIVKCFSHGVMLKETLDSWILSIVKNFKGNLEDSDN